MEAHGVREHPPDTLRGRFVRQRAASGRQRRDPARVRRAAPRRDPCRAAAHAGTWPGARPCTCTHAPTTASSTRPCSTACAALWLQVLGERDLDALDALFAKLIWIPDGELDALDRAAREYRAIIGAPDPPEDGSCDQATDGDRADGKSGGQPARRARSVRRSNRRSSTPAKASCSSSTPTSTCSRCSVTRPARGERSAPRGRGGATGMPTGRMPDRGVDRPPAPDEVQHARRYATRMRQALTHGTRQIDKRTPGGRFDGRAYARGQAQRQTGRPAQHSPVADHPPDHRADPGAARRARDRHLRLDGRLRVRARADLLDPHRRPAPDRRTLRHRPVRQQRRAARRRHAGRCRSSPGSRPAAAPRSPATRSSCSANSSR